MINRALLGVVPTNSPSDQPTLDQLLAEPIVQQLMRRDSIDEATIRHLLRETASARRQHGPKLGASPRSEQPALILQIASWRELL